MIEISIVIPVYNSEECVHELNNQIEESLKGVRHETILVNDGSNDQSWEKIKEVCCKHKNTIGINLRKNAGQDNAIMAGISNSRGKYVVIMDDDLQHSPWDIPRLYQEIRKGYDVCYANFLVKKQRWWKNLGSWLNGKIAEIVILKPRHIYLSPFKIIGRGVIDEVIQYKGTFPYLDGLIFQVTENVTQISIDHHDRFQGKSNYNLIRSILVFMKLVTGFSVQPLRLSSMVGFFVAIMGFIYGLYHILDYFITDHRVEGWTTIIVLILFIGGLILMSLGLIGEYIGRSYLNLNNKPQYSIRDMVNGSGKKIS